MLPFCGNDLDYRAGGGASIEIHFALAPEFDDAYDPRKKRMILANANVATGHDLGAALTDDDFPDIHERTISALYAEILRI